jgi:hypothetical protein
MKLHSPAGNFRMALFFYVDRMTTNNCELIHDNFEMPAFFEQAQLPSGHPSLNDFDTTQFGTEMKVWKFDDYYFIAAQNLSAALRWYDDCFGKSDHMRVVDDSSLTQTMVVGNDTVISFRERIFNLQVSGTRFPTIIAVEGSLDE